MSTDVFSERPSWIDRDFGSPTGAGVRIGVIDSGWDRTLDDPRVISGVSFVDPDDELACLQNDDDHDTNGHGTGCIDIIRRIAPDAEIVPIRVFGQHIETSPGTLQAAIRWAMEQELPLVNVSLGTLRQDAMKPLYVTCERARRRGSILVTAAHNVSEWSFPAVFENVLSVGLLPEEEQARADTRYAYHFRPNDATECLAQGRHQRVQWINDRTVVSSGTSFAAPILTGILALMMESRPDLTLDTVRPLLARYAANDPETVEG
jgi:subtilisin family serine protease